MLNRVKASQALVVPSQKPRKVAPKLMAAGTASSESTGSFHSIKRRKFGNRIAKEIKRLQATTELLIPKLSFARVVREICMEFKDINK